MSWHAAAADHDEVVLRNDASGFSYYQWPISADAARALAAELIQAAREADGYE